MRSPGPEGGARQQGGNYSGGDMKGKPQVSLIRALNLHTAPFHIVEAHSVATGAESSDRACGSDVSSSAVAALLPTSCVIYLLSFRLRSGEQTLTFFDSSELLYSSHGPWSRLRP
jgi:hypothetical protein